jgi:hypothetical protein
MKKLFPAIFVLLLTACSEESKDGINTDMVNNSATASGKVKTQLPEMTFEEEVFDFGRITEGETVSHEFKFKNTGMYNLLITGASGSCGCTVPEWPKEPVKPGEQGTINVVFRSEGKKGHQDKVVTVVTNCEPATRVIRITAEVIVAETAK